MITKYILCFKNFENKIAKTLLNFYLEKQQTEILSNISVLNSESDIQIKNII